MAEPAPGPGSVRLGRGEVAADQIRGLYRDRVRDRGAMGATPPHAREIDAPHDTRDPLVVDPLARFVELGGDPGDAVGAVRFTVHDPYPCSKAGVGSPFGRHSRPAMGR